MTDHFEKVSPKKRIGDALNVLAEAPFFFQRDDPELFAFLRRHRATFARFYEDHFGWQLVVEGPMARLYKSRWVNKALTPSQHDVFDLTRRDECLGFLLVLEFYEHLLDERNASVDDAEPLRFEMGELLAFVGSRLTEELGAEEGGEDAARRILRTIFPTLLRFRFLIDIPPPPESRASLHPDRHLYECTPALHQYDVRLLADAALGRALRQEEDAPEHPDAEAGDDAEVVP